MPIQRGPEFVQIVKDIREKYKIGLPLAKSIVANSDSREDAMNRAMICASGNGRLEGKYITISLSNAKHIWDILLSSVNVDDLTREQEKAWEDLISKIEARK